jgi:hypothetical protein
MFVLPSQRGYSFAECVFAPHVLPFASGSTGCLFELFGALHPIRTAFAILTIMGRALHPAQAQGLIHGEGFPVHREDVFVVAELHQMKAAEAVAIADNARANQTDQFVLPIQLIELGTLHAKYPGSDFGVRKDDDGVEWPAVEVPIEIDTAYRDLAANDHAVRAGTAAVDDDRRDDPLRQIANFHAVVDELEIRGVDVGAVAGYLAVPRKPRLETAGYRSSNAADSGNKSEETSRIFQPVFIFIVAVAALCAGYWRMYFTARRGGFRTWIGDVALFLLGYVDCVINGIWFLIGHAPLSFSSALIHAENACVLCGLLASHHRASSGLESVRDKDVL